MIGLTRAVIAGCVGVGLAAGLFALQRAEREETTITVTVPKDIAGRAARRLAGDATASIPILMLEGLEVGFKEGLTIRVLGPASREGEPRPVLAVTSIVGKSQTEPLEPLQKMTLTVPLNERALSHLAGRQSVTLILQIANSPGRPPVKVERAYFTEE